MVTMSAYVTMTLRRMGIAAGILMERLSKTMAWVIGRLSVSVWTLAASSIIVFVKTSSLFMPAVFKTLIHG